DRAECGQALIGIIAVQRDVLRDQPSQKQVAARRQGAAVEENLVQRLRPVVDPALEGVEEGVAVDEVVLEGQQSEEGVTVGVAVAHGTVSLMVRWSSRRSVFRCWGTGPGHKPDSLDYLIRDQQMQHPSSHHAMRTQSRLRLPEGPSGRSQRPSRS